MTRILAILACTGIAGCGDPVAELSAQLRDSNVEVRRHAARSLGELGTEAAAAVPALETALGDADSEVRRLSGYALGEIGPTAQSALPALKTLLDDEQLAVRMAAAFALQKIDPNGGAQVPTLTKAMRSGDGGVIVAVGQMGPVAAPWAVPTLVALLQRDRRPGIRRLAADSLGQIAPGDEKARAALKQALSDRDDRVREAAQRALGATAPAP